MSKMYFFHDPPVIVCPWYSVSWLAHIVQMAAETADFDLPCFGATRVFLIMQKVLKRNGVKNITYDHGHTQ